MTWIDPRSQLGEPLLITVEEAADLLGWDVLACTSSS